MIGKKQVSLWGFIFLILGEIVAQQEVGEITFSGLRKTKETFLRQYLTVQRGDPYDPSLIEENRQRLTNLEMLGNVSTSIEEVGDVVTVDFQCTEVYTLLPIFNFGGVRDNFWVQVGASEANFAGRGNKLLAYYQYYDRNSVFVSWQQDRIQGSRWGLIANFIKWGTVEPLFFEEGTVLYDYNNDNFGFGTLYHFNFNTKLEVSTAYFLEKYKRLGDTEISAAPEMETTRKQLGKLILYTNRLNYHFFYVSGWHNQLNAEAVYSFDGDPDFYITFDELKYFSRVGLKGNLAGRLRAGISSNDAGPFAPFVLDSYLNIRGVGNRVDRGTAMFIINGEYRHTLREGAKIAVQAVGFSDFGTWRGSGGQINDLVDPNSFEWYGGGGLRFIHKQYFNAIFRVDYAINLQMIDQNGFVIGIGQYF